MKLFLLAVFLILTSILSPVRLQVTDDNQDVSEIVLDVGSPEALIHLTQAQFEQLFQDDQGVVEFQNIYGKPEYRIINTGRELFEAIQRQEGAHANPDDPMRPRLYSIINPERYGQITNALRGSDITLTEDGRRIQVSFPGDSEIFSIDINGKVPNPDDAAFLKFWLIKELSNGNLEIPPGLI